MTRVQLAKNLRAHATALMKIPSGEQFIAHIQAVVSIALEDIARMLESERQQPSRKSTSHKRDRSAIR